MMKGASEYMMILRNTDWDEGLSIAEVAETIDRYHAWVERMAGEGVLTGGRPLFGGGKVIAMGGNRAVTDGPFVETKEVIGGYIVIKAAGLEEAAAIAGTFPPLERGATIELRELAVECPVSARHEERLKLEVSPA